MRIEDFSFGHVTIGGVSYEHDVVIDHGSIRKRKKKPSKRFRGERGHTPLSPEENQRAIRELPRDVETIALFNKLAGPAPLPPR